MTDLSEARKALEFLAFQMEKKSPHFDTWNIADAAIRLDAHIPTILQCLQAAEKIERHAQFTEALNKAVSHPGVWSW